MKFKILILITLIALSGVGYYSFTTSQKSANLQSPISEKPVLIKKGAVVSKKTKKYKDPAGFKFSYPADSKVEVIYKKDPDYYSSLKLSDSKLDASLTIEVTSTEYKSLEDWLKNNKEISNNSKDITLAGLPAKEIISNNKKLTVAVDTETLITITVNYSRENEPYWNEANNTVVSTFAFELPENPADATGSESAGEDVVFEGEEVIE